MKKIIMLNISLLLVLSMAQPCLAQEKKKINLNAENLRKATEIIKRNRELLKNREMIEKAQRLAVSLRGIKR